MQIYYASEESLSEKAKELVEFDMSSIRQLVAAERGEAPELWLVAPEGYQTKGHPLRDSESTRLIAYSKHSRVVYGTDGCNACRHALNTPLETNNDEDLAALSEQTQLPQSLLLALVRIIRE